MRPNGDIVMVYVEVQPVLTTAALYDHEPVAGISGRQFIKNKNPLTVFILNGLFNFIFIYLVFNIILYISYS